MKCLVCDCEVTGSTCPRCGFHTVVVLGSDRQSSAVTEAAENYRQNLLQKTVIELETYEYKLDNYVPSLADISRVRIPDHVGSLRSGEMTWFDREFVSMEAGEDLQLIFHITRDGKVQKKEIQLKAPDIKGPWKVGLMAKGFLDFALVLGSEQQHIETEPFCIIA